VIYRETFWCSTPRSPDSPALWDNQVIYRETSRGVLIVAVAHAKRRPRYWRGRRFKWPPRTMFLNYPSLARGLVSNLDARPLLTRYQPELYRQHFAEKNLGLRKRRLTNLLQSTVMMPIQFECP